MSNQPMTRLDGLGRRVLERLLGGRERAFDVGRSAKADVVVTWRERKWVEYTTVS